MKWNWGTGIALFYGLFMVTMILFVIKSRQVDHSLVVDNYYEEDIRYQEHIDRVANSQALETDLQIAQKGREAVHLQFPDIPGEISGEVWFYRPNDTSRDFKLPATPDANGVLTVDTRRLLPGRWKVKVAWQAGEQQYYKEHELYL
ncbi:MAG: FixH family protein [Saprospiraceae bacterium]|nr:FixH family protein [Saprospiraceae bacterium]